MAYPSTPGRHAIEVIVGDNLAIVVRLLDDEGTGFDLSGATGTGQITAQDDGTVLLALTVGSTGDATRLLADGYFLISATAAQTAGLTAQLAEYAIRLSWSGPTYVATVLLGDCTIRKVWSS